MPKRTQWEYNVFGRPFDRSADATNARLNSEGMDGWELVTVVHQPEQGWITYVMKRPMSAEMAAEMAADDDEGDDDAG